MTATYGDKVDVHYNKQKPPLSPPWTISNISSAPGSKITISQAGMDIVFPIEWLIPVQLHQWKVFLPGA
jgi:hypothetical protein